MKKIAVLFLIFSTITLLSQEEQTESVWRLNFLNPGVEYEMPTGNTSTLSIGTGIGYSGSYPHTSVGGSSGLITSFNPFLDIQHKWFYNFEKRKSKGLNITNNSGNFISARVLTRGESLFGNSNGTDGLDVAIGPTWGIQRKYGKNFHLLFDMGPIYYFDINERHGFFPLMLQLNLGFDL
ncbi:hypothetical protein P8625_15515 [Tenacibaculum tangerinum]|uniref:DUF3996 domain-containing protein n=1 Tax=Tenacibaculum tangerinum TaxID=3038772 RepID=A0ABY8L1Y5_9FLAO|nr:hypothetical protein [Tenacibaculum tangerinum]WGH75457.1 hypothetical protein P8625_15515 [Tenacibaculum tangerinum]